MVNSLHGIVGIVQGFGDNVHKFFYRAFVIPLENYNSVKEGVSTSLFQKKILLMKIESFYRFLLKEQKTLKAKKFMAIIQDFPYLKLLENMEEK